MIRIQVPATSANLGSGFDSLGIALTLYNQVWMEEEDGIFISSRDGLDVPTGEDNLIYWAAKQLYDECGARLPGLRIEQQSDIPMTRGLGSSSACIVAGLLGADRLLGNPFDRHEIVNLANRLEGHPDNTTPAVLGGLVASAVENRRVYSVSVPVAPKIRFAVLIPPFELKTEVARGVLPQEVSRQNAVRCRIRCTSRTVRTLSPVLSRCSALPMSLVPTERTSAAQVRRSSLSSAMRFLRTLRNMRSRGWRKKKFPAGSLKF